MPTEDDILAAAAIDVVQGVQRQPLFVFRGGSLTYRVKGQEHKIASVEGPDEFVIRVDIPEDVDGFEYIRAGHNATASRDDSRSAPDAPDPSNELQSWGEQFDAKIDALTARQEAFLRYLEMNGSR